MKRVLGVIASAVVFSGLIAVTPAGAACVSLGSDACPERDGRGGFGDGFGEGVGESGGGGAPPTISIKNTSKAEGTSQNETDLTRFKLSVVLSHASDGVVKVDFATSPGSASPGEDYIERSGTVSFPAGTTLKKIVVSVRPDFFGEDDEQFFVELSGAKGGKIRDGSGTATIVDDDGKPENP